MATAGFKALVIVESPAKATKIASFLGNSYVVESSRGHVADLPTGASEVPAKYKGEKWARIGVNVDNDFEHLAGRLRCVVRERGRVVFEGTSELAGLEVGSLPGCG